MLPVFVHHPIWFRLRLDTTVVAMYDSSPRICVHRVLCGVCCIVLQGYKLPFDRHDWTVDRCGEEVRYVIDFYNAAPSQTKPVALFLDVRPALDSVGALWDRIRMQARWMSSGRWRREWHLKHWSGILWVWWSSMICEDHLEWSGAFFKGFLCSSKIVHISWKGLCCICIGTQKMTNIKRQVLCCICMSIGIVLGNVTLVVMDFLSHGLALFELPCNLCFIGCCCSICL